MTEITYLDKDGEEKTFSIELPEKLYCRLTLDYKFDYASLSEQDYANDPADMYYYTELMAADHPLFAFIAGYRYTAIEHTPELDVKFDEVITYNDITVKGDSLDNLTYDIFYITNPVPVEADDYVPPTVVVNDPANAPVIPAVEPPADPRNLPLA